MRRHAGSSRRIAAFVAVVAAVTTLAAAMASAEVASPQAAPPVAVPFTTTRALVVDPGTGRVFVAGDDAVAVLAPDGTLLKTISGVYGASGMDATQGAIWVNESTAGAIAKIDPVAMTVARTYTVGASVGDSLTIVGSTAWIGSREQWGGIGRFDLATSTYAKVGSYYAPAARRYGTSTSQVIVFSRGISSGPLFRIDTAPPFTERAAGETEGYLSNIAVDATGSKVFTAAGAPYEFGEFDGATLDATGVTYRAEPYPRDVVWSPAHGGTIAGITYGLLDVYTVGSAAPVASIEVPATGYSRGLALSPDATTAYVVADDEEGVQVVDLRPTATATSVATAVQGNPTSVTVTGQALGGTASVTVGGVAVEPDATSPTAVRFTVPAAAPLGAQPVVLHGTTGDATTTLTITPSTGAVLRGTVRTGDATVPGATLTLAGGGLATPKQATAASDGSYAFPPLGAGTTYSLTVHDPADLAPDQVIRGIELVPNDPTSLDVDLSRPTTRGAEVARTRLSSPSASDLLVDPATGRTAIANGDEVAVLDADGLLVGRFRGLDGAASLALLGGKLYVGVADQGRVARIDLATLTTTGSWPLGRRTTGSIAAAGGKIWFTDGDDQWIRLASLDPATGSIVTSPLTYHDPTLRSIQGSSTRFLVQEALSSAQAAVIDGSGTTPVVIASSDLFKADATPSGRSTAISATNRVYDAFGREFSLTDLTPTGVLYPAKGPTAHAAGHGGVVAFGTIVARAGTPTATHSFGGQATLAGLDAAGDRLVTVEGEHAVVRELGPTLTGASPAQLRANTTVTVTGTGLGAVSAARIDGNAVPFHHVTATSVQLDLPSLSGGVHRLVLTTPWGSTAPSPLDIVPPGPPDAPTSVTATPIVGGLRLNWKAPGYDGGYPVTGYTVTLSPGGATCTTSSLTCSITGLTPGSTFTAKVRATNEKGMGPSSSATAPVPVPTVPTAPLGLRVAARAKAAEITWGYPSSSGGLSISGFRVCTVVATSPLPSASTCPLVTNETYRLVSQLVPHTTYKVAVAAVSPVGIGPLSAPVEVTPYDAPGKPTGVTVTPGTLSAKVAWQAPTDDGGNPIDGYRVCAYEVEDAEEVGTTCTNVGVTTSVTVTGLEGGRTYRVAVRAHNAGADGDFTPRTAPFTVPVSAPGSPASVYLTRGSGSVTVDWTAPAQTGGVPISQYQVCAGTDAALPPASTTCTLVAAPATTATISGLTPGTPYFGSVAAVNALGAGSRTLAVYPVAPFTVPTAPDLVEATAGDGRATVTWGGPLSDGGSFITGWIITPSIGAQAQSPISITGSNRSVVIPGLANGTAYTFRVQAVNAGGPGPSSAPSAAVTPVGAPAPFATWDAFVARQLTDFAGKPGTTASRAPVVAQLQSGALDPNDYITALIDGPWYGPAMAPAIRLYWAYFGRLPDPGGLEYWTNKRRSGTTLIRISASFAGSSEFKRTYGSLSNAEFVDLVYENVLGRPGDASGRKYWITKLDRGTSRGQVMINFSESSEYVRSQAGRVEVVEVFAGMLDRTPSTAEVEQWGGEPVRALVSTVRGGPEYAVHVR